MKSTDTDIAATADMFVKNGISSAVDVENLRAEAREMLIEDLRDEGFKLIDIQLLMDILHLLPPMISQKTSKLHKFGEVNIPQKMKGLAADLDRLESFIKPDHLMVNAISDQISRAKAVPPLLRRFLQLILPPHRGSLTMLSMLGVRKAGLRDSLMSDSANPSPFTAGF